MLARIEVALRPEFSDPRALQFLQTLEQTRPDLRRKIRWARSLDVYWMDIPANREEMILSIGSVFWDRVTQWLFTGNLIPSAAGKHGSVQDLFEAAPVRPGEFWALERRFRPGVTDVAARAALEAFQMIFKRDMPDACVASGSILLVEGAGLDEDQLAIVAREAYCNELVETWTVFQGAELKRSDRFHQERIKRDLPKLTQTFRAGGRAKALTPFEVLDLKALEKNRPWAFSNEEFAAIKNRFSAKAPTDVEMEMLAQSWLEHSGHKVLNAKVRYVDSSGEAHGERIPERIDGLFQNVIEATTQEFRQPWVLSVFSDNSCVIAFDEESALCVKVETHNKTSALDPFSGALTGLQSVHRGIAGTGRGARPIFNLDVFCTGELNLSEPLPEGVFHPRRIFSGVSRGFTCGANRSGVPTVGGALFFDRRFIGSPVVFFGAGGLLPLPYEKKLLPDDRICLVGGRVGRDGIRGVAQSPQVAVQAGDPILQGRLLEFLLAARDHGLLRTLTDNGAGGLSASVGELARLTGGARLNLDRVLLQYPSLKSYEILLSESEERMTVAVAPEKLAPFLALADLMKVEATEIGEFTDSGFFEVHHGGQQVARLDLKFLFQGAPRVSLQAEWKGIAAPSGKAGPTLRDYPTNAAEVLLALLSRPNVASRESLIRQLDHEGQESSVIKPLHLAGAATAGACSGPNDAAVIRPKATSNLGLAVGCGMHPRFAELDPWLMAQAAVDEAVRNVLCSGAEFGTPEAVLGLVDYFCWPDPTGDASQMGALVRACYGLREACRGLRLPPISGNDILKREPAGVAMPPSLLMTAVGRVKDITAARSSDFKFGGDAIFLLGGVDLGLRGSEFEAAFGAPPGAVSRRVPRPNWDQAWKTYCWLGGATGREQLKLHSAHDVSEGGVLTAIAESILARGLGAVVAVPLERDVWEFSFGEGFHSFVVSAAEGDAAGLENEWSELGVPFLKVGTVISQERLDVSFEGGRKHWSIPTRQLRSAWQKMDLLSGGVA